MNTNIEKEYKILVCEKEFNLLCKKYEPLNFIKQTNIYYDTKNNDIRKKKAAMRIRTKDNKNIFTLKLHVNHETIEHECELSENSINALNNPKILDLLSSLNISGPFIKTAELITFRAMVITEEAELCFDSNYYNNIHDYEIEYEYKKEHDGLSVFNNILKQANLVYTKNCSSKIARALKSCI